MRRLGSIAALTFAVSLGVEAAAAPTLDQQNNIAPPAFGDGTAAGADNAQTFTVGLAGILTKVEVWLFTPSFSLPPLSFEIRQTVAGAPVEADSPVLASITVPSSALPAAPSFFGFDVTAFGIDVAVGDVLAWVLRGEYSLPVQSSGTYAGGRRFCRGEVCGPTWVAPPTGGPNPGSQDLGFRTYVDPELVVAAPEPSSLALVGLALTGLALIRRRAA